MPYTPSPTLISGGTGSGNVQSDRRPLDVADQIAFYNPNANPFFLLAQKASKKAVTDPEFKMLESQIQPYFDAINKVGGYSAAAVSIVVDNGSYFKADDLVLNTRTNEIFLVSSVSTNTLMIVRSYGSTAAAAMNDNDEIRRLANAFEEGAGADVSKTVQVDSVDQYCQIHKTSLTVTRTVENTFLYGGMEMPLRRKNSGIEHAQKIEASFLFGQRARYLTSSATNAATNHPRRLTGGILYFISSNVVAIDGALTEATFNNEFLRPVFSADLNFRKKRTLFVSPLVGGVMNQWGNGKVRLVPADQTFGITVNRYLSFLGEVNIVNHPLLAGDEYGGYMIATDLENAGYRFLQNSDTKLSIDIVKDGSDQQVDQFLTECGLWLTLEGVHGVATGISG